MTPEELYSAVLTELPIKSIHPLHKAIMEECCENAINSNATDKSTLIYAVQVSFMTCVSLLQDTLKGAIEAANADQVTLNYRGQSFIIPKNSPLLQK